MWDLIPGDLLILVHNGLYRYVSRGTGYRGRWWLGVLITTVLGVIQVGLGWLTLVVGLSDALILWRENCRYGDIAGDHGRSRMGAIPLGTVTETFGTATRCANPRSSSLNR